MVRKAKAPAPLLSFSPLPEVREAFTEGDCWFLAMALEEAYPSCEASLLEDNDGDATHAFLLLPNGMALDVEGLYPSPQALAEAWRRRTRRDQWQGDTFPYEDCQERERRFPSVPLEDAMNAMLDALQEGGYPPLEEEEAWEALA